MHLEKTQLAVYAVTDRKWLKTGQTLAGQVEQAILGGATIIQLREKHVDNTEFLAIARELKTVTERYHVPLIINDNLDVAKAVDADGIHVGQSDVSAEKVRAELGNAKILGVSAQTVEQALKAQLAGADYLGVGAVFPTTSKDDAAEVPYNILCDICEAVSIPVVAIGGVNAENMMQLRGSGVDGVAVISAIFGKTDVKEGARVLKQKWQEMTSL